MNKYIVKLSAAFVVALALTACNADEGTEPGNDSMPVVTVYQYAPGDEYNADNDVKVRFVANNVTSEAYYVIEPTETRDAYIQANGEVAYMAYIVENGTKLDDIKGESYQDMIFTGLEGSYTVSAVAVNGGNLVMRSGEFVGLAWEDVCTGTYQFAYNIGQGVQTKATTLQQCTNQEGLYRLKDLYSAGYSLKVQAIDMAGEDEDGVYQYMRIPYQSTGFLYQGGPEIEVSDVGYWKENDAYITQNGFHGGMYEDNFMFLIPVYQVPGVGHFGYQKYEYFIPD